MPCYKHSNELNYKACLCIKTDRGVISLGQHLRIPNNTEHSRSSSYHSCFDSWGLPWLESCRDNCLLKPEKDQFEIWFNTLKYWATTSDWMSDELRLNSFLIEIGFSVCLGLAATQILHHIKLDKTELFADTLKSQHWHLWWRWWLAVRQTE